MNDNGVMLTIQCETASFRGRGTFACRKCCTVTELHTGMAAVLMVLPDTRLVFDAQTGALLHDCRWVARALTEDTTNRNLKET